MCWQHKTRTPSIDIKISDLLTGAFKPPDLQKNAGMIVLMLLV
jgi:hypothetical protein